MSGVTKAREALERNRYNRSALTVKAERCPECGYVIWHKQTHECQIPERDFDAENDQAYIERRWPTRED